MNTPIVIVGSYVQDLTFFTPQFPSLGETVIGNFQTGPGGKGSNQAVAALRAGVPTTFIGAVGQDAFATVAKDFHAEEGVNAKWLEVPNISTGAASIIVNQKAQNQIVVALGACDHLDHEAVATRFPEHAEMVVTQLETHLQGSTSAMKKGKALGAVTVLNPAPMRNDFPKEILDDVEVLIPNETEFVSLLKLIDSDKYSHLTDQDLETLTANEVHEMCRELNVPTVILTLGERGAFLSTKERFCSYPPLSDIEVVDTTGAGDAFVGGFAAGWIKFDHDLDRAIKYGILVAGLSVTKIGTAPAMPKVRHIESMQQELSIQI